MTSRGVYDNPSLRSSTTPRRDDVEKGKRGDTEGLRIRFTERQGVSYGASPGIFVALEKVIIKFTKPIVTYNLLPKGMSGT